MEECVGDLANNRPITVQYVDVIPEDVLFGIFRKLKLLDADSFAIEDFSLAGLRGITIDDITARLEEFRNIVAF